MADVDYEDYGYSEPQHPEGGRPESGRLGIGRAQRMMNIAGACSSLALVVGLAVWGYNLAVRNVNGVPVIRAHSGPMRVAPEEPGGRVTDHQGLSVNAVAAEGIAAGLPDTLTLAPRAAELDYDDEAGLRPLPPVEAEAAAQLTVTEEGNTLSGLEAAVEGSEEPSEEEQAAMEAAGEAGPAVVASAASGAVLSVAGAAAQAGTATGQPEAAAPAGESAEQVSARAAEVKAEGGMVRSLRPRLRVEYQPLTPAPTADTITAATTTTAAVAAPKELKSEDIKAGTRLVQLGAFDSADQARGEWTRLQDRFPALLGSKALVIQSAESGGRTFYRLRAHGFDGEDDARRFCTALLAEGAACIPVAQR